MEEQSSTEFKRRKLQASKTTTYPTSNIPSSTYQHDQGLANFSWRCAAEGLWTVMVVSDPDLMRDFRICVDSATYQRQAGKCFIPIVDAISMALRLAWRHDDSSWWDIVACLRRRASDDVDRIQQREDVLIDLVNDISGDIAILNLWTYFHVVLALLIDQGVCRIIQSGIVQQGKLIDVRRSHDGKALHLTCKWAGEQDPKITILYPSGIQHLTANYHIGFGEKELRRFRLTGGWALS